MAATKRRWLRFSLRTMFVAFTVVALWLGWNVYAVRERKAALESLGLPYGLNYFDMDLEEPARTVLAIYWASEAGDAIYGLRYKQIAPTSSSNLPALRQWLGDKPVAHILYTPGIDPERLSRLFPEAIIMVPADK